ncbi:hypothetical protein ACFP56_14910 [Paenibacillus septentrionalis]|uniref:Uncharacterized protein n=1 Tax=Paenibacillus septentrionalis TaxID=429342 RepID=A0ABW1V7U9_9BACL
MNSARQFMLTLFAWILFMVGAFTFLSNEWSPLENISNYSSKDIVEITSISERSLTEISGEQLIGMVPFALNGDYKLIIDNIVIDHTIDIASVNLRNVIGLTYTLTIYRDNNGIITSIKAVH